MENWSVHSMVGVYCKLWASQRYFPIAECLCSSIHAGKGGLAPSRLDESTVSSYRKQSNFQTDTGVWDKQISTVLAPAQEHPIGNFEEKTILSTLGDCWEKIYLLLTPSKSDGRVSSQQGAPATCNLNYWEVYQQTYVQTLLASLGVVIGQNSDFQ